MSTIHLGQQLGPLGPGRIVAIKRLQEASAHNADFRRMFLDEARITSRLEHPHLVRTLDVVSTDTELLIVMELVRGDALSSLLSRCKSAGTRIPLPILSAIVVGALDGLHAAHEAVGSDGAPLEVVHRDVSPHNILVGTDGVARIADFGIAKALGRAHVTRSGELKGKLAFMAPEQIRGAAVDRRADVYAVAVVLWEACTGARLFAGDGVNVVFQVLEDAPSPPSQLRPEIPPPLEKLILRGLQKDASKRFASAFEMARALEAVVSPARPHEVGAWVREVGRENLEKQSELIRAVERADPGSSASALPEDLGSARATIPGSSPPWAPDAGQVMDRKRQQLRTKEQVELARGQLHASLARLMEVGPNRDRALEAQVLRQVVHLQELAAESGEVALDPHKVAQLETEDDDVCIRRNGGLSIGKLGGAASFLPGGSFAGQLILRGAPAAILTADAGLYAVLGNVRAWVSTG
jgi:serine/threonine-protein kinase